jgi:hypothetical protein
MENYPTINFWYKKQRGKEITRRRLTQQTSNSGSSRCTSQDENSTFWFLQNVDGTVVDRDIVTSMHKTARLVWTCMSDEHRPMGLPWKSVHTKHCLEFWLRLEHMYPFLHLCANHYKADAVATEDYTHWYNAHGRKWRCTTKLVSAWKSRRSGSLCVA